MSTEMSIQTDERGGRHFSQRRHPNNQDAKQLFSRAYRCGSVFQPRLPSLRTSLTSGDGTMGGLTCCASRSLLPQPSPAPFPVPCPPPPPPPVAAAGVSPLPRPFLPPAGTGVPAPACACTDHGSGGRRRGYFGCLQVLPLKNQAGVPCEAGEASHAGSGCHCCFFLEDGEHFRLRRAPVRFTYLPARAKQFHHEPLAALGRVAGDSLPTQKS